MSLDPKVIAFLQKLESDGLADCQSLLVPALLAEIQELSPSGAQATESVMFAALSPVIQSALASLIAKIPPIA